MNLQNIFIIVSLLFFCWSRVVRQPTLTTIVLGDKIETKKN